MNRRQVLGLLGGFVGSAALPTARGQPSGFDPLGRLDVPNATETVVSDDGRIAFVTVRSGFAVVDVSDPTSPTIVAERHDILADHDDGPMVGIIDVKVDGDRLVVPGPGNATRDVVPTGFVLFDVSDPRAPERLAFHETSLPIHNACIEDGRVYLTQATAVDIVDIAGEAPATVGTIELADLAPDWSDVDARLRPAHDVWVRDHVAYIPLWEAGTVVADVSDPASPSLLAHLQARPLSAVVAIPPEEMRREAIAPPGNHHYAQAAADGRLLAIGKESWETTAGDGSGGPSGIELWDIAEPSDPLKLSEIHPPRAANETRRGTWTTAHNFDLVGDRLYSSWYQGGVKIHDVSDPGDPVELAWWRQPDEVAFWTAVQATTECFLASGVAGNVGSALTEGLFTFPTAPGEQVDPPAILTPAPTPSRLATARPTPEPSPTPTAASPPITRSRGNPGFGVFAGLAGLGAGLWWQLRTRDDDP